MNGVTFNTITSVTSGGERVRPYPYSRLRTKLQFMSTVIPKLTSGGKLGLSIPSKLSDSIILVRFPLKALLPKTTNTSGIMKCPANVKLFNIF